MIRLHNVIDGESVEGAETASFTDPATGEIIGEAPSSSSHEIDAAMIAADKGYRRWRRATPLQRQKALLAFADLIDGNIEELLEMEVRNTGKPRAITRDLEISRSADQVRFFAGAARVLNGLAQGEYVEGFTSSVRREPVGVVAQVTPWNYPLMMAIWKIAPAIAAGNAVVLKPAETTPWSTVRIAELAQEVLPPGVLNVVCGGRNTGRNLVAHSRPDMVAITGSTRAGSEVMASAAAQLKNVHLELGGKAPTLVFGDVDLEATASAIAQAGYFNAGQDCTAATRVLVEERVHDEFVSLLAEAARQLKPGGPDDVTAGFGPLNNPDQKQRVEGYLERLSSSAEIVAGGGGWGPGYFMEATVVTGVGQLDEVVQEEIFGPVLTVQSFSDREDAAEKANGVKYALSSSIWTNDHKLATKIAGELDFGTVWVNCHQVIPTEMPHGGFKGSGVGKDLSVFGIEDYTRIKHVMSSHS